MRTLEQEITEILEHNKRSRDSNEVLYAVYLSKHGITMPSVWSFFTEFERYKVSSFESVTRARRKIVEKNPRLGASEEMKQIRIDREYDMWDYAKDRGKYET